MNVRTFLYFSRARFALSLLNNSLLRRYESYTYISINIHEFFQYFVYLILRQYHRNPIVVSIDSQGGHRSDKYIHLYDDWLTIDEERTVDDV